MNVTLVVTMESVEKCGILELVKKCESMKNDKVSEVKVLIAGEASVSASILRDIVECDNSVDVEILPFANESEEFFMLGTVLQKDGHFVFDEVFGNLPWKMFKQYDIEVLPSSKQKQKRGAGDTSNAGQKNGNAPSKSVAKRQASPKKEQKVPANYRMTFEDLLFSKGIKEEHFEKLKGILRDTKDRDTVRNQVMTSFGLDLGGKMLAKLDGSFSQLHELACEK